MPIALDLSKRHTWPNQKSEVDLRRYGRHLVKSISPHNSVGDHPICIKFGMPVQAHDVIKLIFAVLSVSLNDGPYTLF